MGPPLFLRSLNLTRSPTSVTQLLGGLLLLFVAGCALIAGNLVEINTGRFPFFIDDSSQSSLIKAIDQHIGYLRKKSSDDTLTFGTLRVSPEVLIESLTYFSNLVETESNPLELNRLIRENFRIFKASGRNNKGDMLVTGYYEPTFEGSLTKTYPYIYPLHKVPQTLVVKRIKGSKKTGRLDEAGNLVPFWSRKEIVSQNILKQEELVYLKDRMDAYLLQVQGSGRIRLPNGSLKSLHFAGSNGLEYESLGKLFVDKDLMTTKQVNIEAMRTYFYKHPEDMDEMLFHNPRYIFFQWGDDHGPRGSLGEILTADRSVAIDHSILPTGAIGYLVSRRPVLNDNGTINHWRVFSRFVLPQDSGSAIKGPGRVDLFLGNGHYAETAAGNMKETGELYFLLKKEVQ